MKKHLALFSFVVLASIGWVIFGGSEKVSAQDMMDTPTFHVAIARDALGEIVPGFAYEGWVCTSYDGEPSWLCSYLNDFPDNPADELASTGNLYFSLDVTKPESAVTTCSNSSIGNFIMIRQTAAPTGYNFSDEWNVFCALSGSDGWVADGTQIRNDLPLVGKTSQGVSIPLLAPPVAKIASGVTAQYKTESGDPDAPDWLSYNITFGGLLGATAEAKIPDPPASDSTTVQPKPPMPTLADTGSNKTSAFVLSAIVTTISVLLAVAKIPKIYRYNKR